MIRTVVIVFISTCMIGSVACFSQYAYSGPSSYQDGKWPPKDPWLIFTYLGEQNWRYKTNDIVISLGGF